MPCTSRGSTSRTRPPRSRVALPPGSTRASRAPGKTWSGAVSNFGNIFTHLSKKNSRRGFWEFFYPQLQAEFPEQLKGVSLDQFYRAINKVERSLIRTDADEVTYNLHVMLRFDFELQLLEGSLSIRDLPEAWHERFEQDFGIVPPSNADGVMQDVHWYGGAIGGAFQGYTLGNILSAQFYASALQAHPEIPAQMRQGQFATLRGWLTENVYRHGRKFTAPELVQRATGQPLTIAPYVQYLKTKYGELYHL